MTTEQLKAWKGEFGRGYTDRNRPNREKIDNLVRAFGRMLDGVRPKSVLEVGSNLGMNLLALRRLLGEDTGLAALEPNDAARRELAHKTELNLTETYDATAFDIPARDGSFELVFTVGVLIHIAPGDLERAVREIVRVSNRYVLCAEYFSHEPEEKAYRGQEGLLFKRDFGAFFLDVCPELRPIGYGFLWQREFSTIDNKTWWLLEKSPHVARDR